MNKVILVGRIAADLELKSTKNGKSVMTFPIAVNRKYKSEGYPMVDFFNVVVWAKQAEVIHQYLGKGKQLAFTGRLQSRSYDANDGTKRYTTEVVLEDFDFIGNKAANGEGASENRSNVTEQSNASQDLYEMDLDNDFNPDIDEDTIPF